MSTHQSSSQHGRAAFSLVELLVVIAILGILLGLILTAAQKARESAHRAACINNLKQLGLALHAYHDGAGRFPNEDDWNDGSTPSLTGTLPTTLYAELLPFVEQQNQVATWRTDPQPVNVFLCPSRRSTAVGARDDYAGGLHQAWFGDDEITPLLSILGGTMLPDQPYGFPGVSLDTVTNLDGSGSTLLLAHKGLMATHYDGSGQGDEGWAHIGDFFEHKRNPGASISLEDGKHNFSNSFASPHPNAMPALFADGSVRVLSYKLSPSLLVLLWSFNDGRSVTEVDLRRP